MDRAGCLLRSINKKHARKIFENSREAENRQGREGLKTNNRIVG